MSPANLIDELCIHNWMVGCHILVILGTGEDLEQCRSRSGSLECSGCDRKELARSGSQDTWQWSLSFPTIL